MRLSRLAPYLMTLMILAARTTYADQASVTASIDGKTITAHSITPGGAALFFGAGLGSTGYDSIVMRWSEVVLNASHDGTATFTAPKPIPFRSIIAVVDMQTGRYAIVAPPGNKVPAPESRGFTRDERGTLQLFGGPAPVLDAVFVRPGAGAWRISASDSGPLDADGRRDGFTTVRLSDFTPIGHPGGNGNERRVSEFTPGAGGVLIAIDYYNMAVYAARLDESHVGE